MFSIDTQRARSFGAALTLGVAFAAMHGTAAAQSTPLTAASPAPSATPAAGGGNPTVTNPNGGPPAVPAGPATRQQAVGHLPIFDITPIFTQPDFYSSKSQIHAYDPLDIGGTIRIPISRKFSLQFDRTVGGTLNQPLQRQGATLPGESRDVVLQYHATYAFNRYFTADVGDSFRHRIYNNDASGVSNVPFPYTVASTEHHFAYAGVAYTTPRLRGLLNSQFVFGETLDVQNVDHHVGTLCTAALIAADDRYGCSAVGSVGYIDEAPGKNRYYETTQSVTWIVPINHGATFSYQERWGYLNFYENQPYPFNYTSAGTALLNKKFSSLFSLGVRYQYNVEDRVGAPFPQGVIHVGSYDVLANFHVDTNTLLHH